VMSMLCAGSNSIVTTRGREEIKIAAVGLAVSQHVKRCCDVSDISKEPRASQGHLLINNNNNNPICKAPECQKTSVALKTSVAMLLHGVYVCW